MFRFSLTSAKIAALAAVLVLATASQGEAQFRGGGRGYGGGGYGGGYGGYRNGITFGIGSGGIGIGYGQPGYYGNNYYGNSYYGHSGYPYSSYGSNYGYQPFGYNSYYGTPAYSTLQPIPDINSYQSSYPPSNVMQPDNLGNTAMIEVTVPPNVDLWFDGNKTQQTGSTRYFVTPPLTPGQTFSYEVRIAPPNSPDNASTTRRVEVQAGKRVSLNFNESAGTPR